MSTHSHTVRVLAAADARIRMRTLVIADVCVIDERVVLLVALLPSVLDGVRREVRVVLCRVLLCCVF